VAVCLVCQASVLAAADASPRRQPVGDLKTLSGWQGLSRGANLAIPGEAVFTCPPGTNGWHWRGLRVEHDGTSDWRDFYGLQLEVNLDSDQPIELTALIKLPPQLAREDFVSQTKAAVIVRGKGRQIITLPWSAFDFQQAQPSFLKFVSELHLSARFTEGDGKGKLTLGAVRLVKGETISLDAEILGKSGRPGETVEYTVAVGNCTDKQQSVTLQIEKHGWEEMSASVEPASLQLAPGESKPCVVYVKVSPRVPPGGRQEQKLRAIANGDGSSAATLTFTTASFLPHPNIIHTAEGWNDVREKVKNFDWARQGQARYVEKAEAWRVPEVAKAPNNVTGVDSSGPFLFETSQEHNVMAAGVAWQLTRNTNYAQKVALFLRRLSNPTNGYPTTLRGCNQSFVQEGHFMQHCAMAYDMALDSAVFSDADRAQIENTFRIYAESVRLDLENGAINNWQVSEICGVFYAALAMQDWHLAERILSSPAGILDQMRHGIMDDGWWYECSISYNTWVAAEFSQVAIALRPWGVNLVDAWLPNGFTRNYGLVPWSARPGLYGMNFEKFGPVAHSYVNLKRMWDALPPFGDYRGIIFGINDTTEKPLAGSRVEVGGAPYEIAYYLYRDPAYATIIKQGGLRDLIYGVPELPEQTPDLAGDSRYADNVGVAILRSKAKEPRERIQAVLHYGSHGGFHGHFDRGNLLSLMRYGQSFYNPEMIWYGYASFLYKFYVQTSMSKNMVVVDAKQQEPVESPRLLFHTGEIMQAAAIETDARWSDPPFGGMRYPEQPAKNLPEKLWREGRWFPIPINAQPYGEIGAYSDRVRQRRLMIVTSDYVVLADHLRAPEQHTFDSLFQIKGFRGLESADRKLIRHDAQMTTDGRSAAQFITDCDWYEVAAPARGSFDDKESFKMDVISLWPPKVEFMVGNAPEVEKVNKQLTYTVRGDGKTLAEGEFGSWILGRADIDIPVTGVKQLELETKVNNTDRNTVFWGTARVVLADGIEKSLADGASVSDPARNDASQKRAGSEIGAPLSVKFENVVQPKEQGKDYYGGPITITGEPFTSAVAGQPAKRDTAGIVRVDLSDVKGIRFKATLGGDYPTGDESQQRKTIAIRTNGKETRYLTLLEPYETQSSVRKAEALSADKLRVELNDGRVQEIEISNFTGDGKSIEVQITETKDGQVLRRETTLGKETATR
jgi:Alginate lyase